MTYKKREEIEDFEEYLIARNAEPNCSEFLKVTSYLKENKFTIRKLTLEYLNKDEWVKTNKQVPSQLFYEYLRKN